MGLLGRDAAQAEEEGSRAEETNLRGSMRQALHRFVDAGAEDTPKQEESEGAAVPY